MIYFSIIAVIRIQLYLQLTIVTITITNLTIIVQEKFMADKRIKETIHKIKDFVYRTKLHLLK